MDRIHFGKDAPTLTAIMAVFSLLPQGVPIELSCAGYQYLLDIIPHNRSNMEQLTLCGHNVYPYHSEMFREVFR